MFKDRWEQQLYISLVTNDNYRTCNMHELLMSRSDQMKQTPPSVPNWSYRAPLIIDHIKGK